MNPNDLANFRIGFDPGFITEVRQHMNAISGYGEISGTDQRVIKLMDIPSFQQPPSLRAVPIQQCLRRAIIPAERKTLPDQHRIERKNPFLQFRIDQTPPNQARTIDAEVIFTSPNVGGPFVGC